MIVYEKYKLCRGFFIPEGWRILKNNLFNVEPNILDELDRDSDEYLDLEDQLFYEDIFIANTECSITSKKIKSHTSVSISCFLDFNEEKNTHLADFSVEISIIELKNREEIFNENREFDSVHEAVAFASDLMETHSFYFIPSVNQLVDYSLINMSNLAKDIFNK